MDSRFYKLPIDFRGVFDDVGEPLQACGEKESIDQFIETLLLTCPGEHKFDKEFGCKIWELDFVRMTSKVTWEQSFATYVAEAIEKYEHRISDISVETNVVEEVKEDMLYDSISIKKRATVVIKSRLLSTGENVAFYYTLYLCPLSNK